MKLPTLSFLVQAFVDACARFPATMLCAFTGTFSVMAAIEHDGRDGYIKIWIMAQLGLALCTGLAAWAESRAWSLWRTWGVQAAGLAYLVAYYLVFDMDSRSLEGIDLPRYFGLLFAAHLFVAVAPFLNRLPVADFWEYNKQLFANFIIGAVYATILHSGLSLALLAVNELFDLNISGKMYAHLFVLLAGVFQTTFFLYHFPARFQFEEKERSYNIVFKNLCRYILIPIVGLYFLILYAYSFKILVTWNLPQGWVSALVLGFSVAGIFTYLINYLLPEYSDSKIVQAYRKWFWWVLLPMVGLLFVAVGRRISDYGITPERYFVAHAGVWLLVMCVYFLWSKTDNIKFIPISLGLFVLVAAIGPLSAFEVSERNQVAILRGLLEKNGRFEGSVLKVAGSAAPKEDAERIHSCLLLLGKHDAFERIESWFPVPVRSITTDTTQNGYYTRATDIARWLKAAPADVVSAEQLAIVSVYLRQPKPPGGSISGYRTFSRIDLHDGGGAPNRPAGHSAVFSPDGKALLLFGAGSQTATDSISLEPAMQAWKTAAGSNDYFAMSDTASVLELRGRKSVARLYVWEARFDKKEMRMQSLSGILFAK